MKKMLIILSLSLCVGCIACAGLGYEIYWRMLFYDPESIMPPTDFHVEDLVGTWRRGSKEFLLIRSDYTFKQRFTDKKHPYETGWNRWWLEELPAGKGIRLHLEGARNYASILPEYAERGAIYPPIPEAGIPERPISFWDPFAKEFVTMPHKLVLQIRVLPSGELILHHLSPPGEALFLGEGAIYHKIKE